MNLEEKEYARLAALVNDIEEARQAYDDAVVPEHHQLDRVLAAGDHLSNTAHELHNYLVILLTRVRSE